MGAKVGESIEGVIGTSEAFREVLNAIPVAIAILDSRERVLFMNRALEALTGFDLPSVMRVPGYHVLRTNLLLHEGALKEAPNGSAPVTLAGDLINRDRRKLSVRLTSTALRDEQGEAVGWLVAVEDVSAPRERDHELEREYGFGPLLGRSRRMKELFGLIPVIAQTDSSVLLTGETGTGKDLVAEVIHEASDRARGPFVKVNCGALPEALLESELFGHKRGAFTGAVDDKPGRIRLAHGGTFYLTEVGDLALSLQVKLLTFLDDKVIYPLGGTKGFRADVRIIAATHRDLEGMAERGEFRLDLLYRLNVVRLRLPPLRERAGDIELLLEHFLRVFSSRFGKKAEGLSRTAREILLDYHFPGNVRELRNILEYATNVCQGSALLPEHLPTYLLEPLPRHSLGGGSDPERPMPLEGPERLRGSADATSWAELERRLILDAMVKTRGRKAKAAEMLGWGRSTLWRKMKRHGIEG